MEYLNYNNIVHQHADSAGGFRLDRLEIYNWGTFNRHVWIMSPYCGTALLTGANGSGKSTLADALLTLLVPYQRRTYNQASGAEKHRERDERTYILGAWSKQKDTTSNRARPEYLRTKNDYSVLLAVFRNNQQAVTLAQVLRIQDEDIDKLFVVAPCELNIEEHFRLTSTTAELRKQLRARGAEVYNDFAKYNRHFRQLVNVRSEKAFDLFNQIVSIKEIGGLNDFVRKHMLEKTNAAKRITELRENFDNLTRSHESIQLAQKQIDILEPLIQDANKYAEQQKRIYEAQRCSELVPIYIAARKQALLEAAIVQTQHQLTEQQGHLLSIEQALADLKQQQIQLNVAIGNNQIGQQINQWQQEIEKHTIQQNNKRAEANKYNSLARKIGLPEYQDESTFYQTMNQVHNLLAQTTARLKTLTNERDTYKKSAANLEATCEALEEELTSLKQRKSQIPAPDIAIRTQMLALLNIPEHELPFIGELLRVSDTEQRWEAAIERLLHNFARQLIVPEHYYPTVSRYVDTTNLHGRLIYHRVAPEPRTPRNTSSHDRSMLYNKLDIKADSPFSTWLTAEVIDTYDYLCCETLEAFHNARRALTVNGQIRHNRARHEKDDRSPLGDRKSYVLGWNNAEKLAALATDLSQHRRELHTIEDKIQNIEHEQSRAQDRQRQLQRLLEFESFALIDWQTDQQCILELRTQVQELEKNSSLATLRSQLAEVNQQYDTQNKQRDTIKSAITTLNNTINTSKHQRERCESMLRDAVNDEVAPFLAYIEKEHKEKPLTIETAEQEQSNLIMFYTRRANSLQGQQTALRDDIIRHMGDFRQTSSVIAQEVDASLEAIEHYRRHYERIKQDDLPRFLKRFKELLNDNVILGINSFKVALETQEREIKDSIAKLNSSLNKIEYTPLTYIQLCHERAYDKEVSDFKIALRACLPDVSQQRTLETNEASFQRIRALIERFEQDERWTTKVTDVRNWLDFSAQELYREDDKPKNYYSDSSGKSGGQKTKLAYTILASAIAYQYGLDQQEHERAFRFVVVDEAFSKSDELNARYAMQLFKQLDLQLLVVTPLDKIHVIEPYISACHFVANNEDENDSKIYNLSIEEYHQQKQAIQTGVLIGDYAN